MNTAQKYDINAERHIQTYEPLAENVRKIKNDFATAKDGIQKTYQDAKALAKSAALCSVKEAKQKSLRAQHKALKVVRGHPLRTVAIALAAGILSSRLLFR